MEKLQDRKNQDDTSQVLTSILRMKQKETTIQREKIRRTWTSNNKDEENAKAGLERTLRIGSQKDIRGK